MNKAGLIVGIVIIAAAVAGAIFYLSHPSEQQAVSQQQGGTGNGAVGATGASAVVTYSDAGFSPSPLTIAVGTTVTWTNQSSHPMWIEGTGPSGGDCTSAAARTSLNECQSVSSGGTFSYTFTTLGTATYFNHDLTSDKGIVIVTEASSSGPINPNAIPE